jgi:23S rRNA pseudouridine2605 synthase
MQKAKRIRLQSYLAQTGEGSRRSCEKLIEQGAVRVNGTLVTKLGTTVDPDRDLISVGGKDVRIEPKKLFLFHKPRGVVTTLSDPQGRKSIAQFLREMPIRVFPVGRLDFDVNGLLLLTNDGDLAMGLLHPRYEVPRTYIAIVRGLLTEEISARALDGLRLDDGFAKAKSIKLLRPNVRLKSIVDAAPGPQESLVEITVAEGRKHFVKRFLKRLGIPVVRLTRISFGNYQLGQLKPGEIKEIALINGAAV